MENKKLHNEEFKINSKSVGLVIGRGGKTIKEIIALSNNSIIDLDNEGNVKIQSENIDDLNKAKNRIIEIDQSNKSLNSKELFENETYDANIKDILDFGIIVEVEGNEGLLHISKISNDYISDLKEEFNIGDVIQVKLDGPVQNNKYRFKSVNYQ